MADTESILQLGIEAARAGDKEEARNLFRLLTRETPEDPQAWLWLAGVAEDREEKRAALEQVTNLDPSNELAKQGLAALGGPSKAPKAAPPAPAAAPADDDFSFDWNQPAETEAPSFAMADPEPTPAPAAPARTRELTPDEEFAMSLDSFGSLSNTYNERSKSGSGDAMDFNIPDFGDDDDLDLSAYMNRERVDVSSIEVTAEEAKKPVRKAISKGGISDEAKARYKEKKPKVAGARASGGLLPILIMAGIVLALLSLVYFMFFRDKGEDPVADANATATALAGGGVAGLPTPVATVDPALPTVDPALPTIDPNAGGGVTDQPTAVPGGETPTEGQPPTTDPGPGAGGSPDAGLANLGGIQPNILPADGFSPVTVDNWFFNFGGITTIADGNAIGVQPQGRWLLVGVLMFDGSLEGRTIPGDLMVLKDAQGRVYRANADASEAYLNTYPGSFNINLKQPAPVNFNFSVPLLFDVSPDATDLVLFSPLATDQGYAVRPNAQ
ncbi:MAG TPA: tetratricopeptide repeat protein [Herpetosiphonaceae bacterium]|nr:tetratricopeptide repeat protein [Herpetosiphonaceae bacterium]